MDLRIRFLFLFSILMIHCTEETGVFRVQRKFAGGGGGRKSIAHLRLHDAKRHGRLLASTPAAPVEFPLGGSALPTEAGLYYTKISLGTPPKDFYVQVDTGSDILWVNCVNCKQCPEKSNIGVRWCHPPTCPNGEGGLVPLSLYDPKDSGSGHLVTCDNSFCAATYPDFPGCNSNVLCQYNVLYGDGSSTAGFFVSDLLQYQQVVSNNQTKAVSASVTFGCGAQQSGDLGSSSEGVDGILGFGQSNSSMLSQLASAGKVRKIFSHCLDTVNGGGIFAIGEVVQPKVKTTPLVPNQPHYNVELKSIDVGGDYLKLPTDVFDSSEKGTIIDSGTTLAYLPESAYKPLMNAIFSHAPNIQFHHVQSYLCFQYTQSVDDAFPKVTFHFDGSVSLTVYPHDYLFENQDNEYCVGWQSGGVQTRDGKDIFLLGDLALSNKLVVYDLENHVIGWTDYNCSSSIKVEGDKSGTSYTVNAQDLSFACRLEIESSALLLLLAVLVVLLFN